VRHTYQVINSAGEVEGRCINMQTGVRGYRATGNKDFLQPYLKSGTNLPGNLKELESLVSDNPSPVSRVKALIEETEILDSFWRATNEIVVTTY